MKRKKSVKCQDGGKKISEEKINQRLCETFKDIFFIYLCLSAQAKKKELKTCWRHSKQRVQE